MMLAYYEAMESFFGGGQAHRGNLHTVALHKQQSSHKKKKYCGHVPLNVYGAYSPASMTACGQKCKWKDYSLSTQTSSRLSV